MNDTAMIPAPSAEVARQEFAGVDLISSAIETAAVAVAAREKAEVESRYLMAERHPRSIEQFRSALLRECTRPSFAAVARYSKPQGKGHIHGPTIRFIETAMRCYRNISAQVTTVYDAPTLRICRVAVTDFESNTGYAVEVQVQKAVERKGYNDKPPEGREIISERLNSYGEKTYLVVATDDELIVKQNALVSKAIRTSAQRLLPGDIVEEAMVTVVATIAAKDAKDPDAAKRNMLDQFAEKGVEPSDLEQLVGHPLERLTAKEVTELRGIYTAIKDGQATWEDIMFEANPTHGSTEAQAEVAEKKLAGLRGRGKKAKPKAKPKTEEPNRDQLVATAIQPAEAKQAEEQAPDEEPPEPAWEDTKMTEAEMQADEEASGIRKPHFGGSS